MPIVASASELEAIKTVNDAREWIALAQEAWDALDAALGSVPNLRLLALLSPELLQHTIKSSMVQPADGIGRPRKLSMIEVHQAFAMRSLARQKFNLPDEDPLEDLIPSDDEEEEEPEQPAAEPPAALPAAAASSVQPAAKAAPRPPEPAPGAPAARAMQPAQSSATFSPPMRPEVLEERQQKLTRPVSHLQMMETETFYDIHRTRGLHLGPRFRAVKIAGGVPGSCFAALRPMRPARRLLQAPSKEDRWWRNYLPGAAPPPAPELEEEQPRQMTTGRASRKNLWPGGKVPKPGRGDGLLRDLHEPIWGLDGRSGRQPTNLTISQELVRGGGLVLPARANSIPGLTHPAFLQEEEGDDCDEPWSFLPGLYDAILTCTFLEGNPVPGTSTSQLPLPFLIRDFRVSPHASRTDSYFGQIHPWGTGASHYCDIATEDGITVASADGFEPRATRPAAEGRSAAESAGATRSFRGYVYRTASQSPGRTASPAPAVGSAGASTATGSSSTQAGSRGSAGRSTTPGARRGKKSATQATGSTPLAPAEQAEVAKRVANWSKLLS